MVFMGRGFTSGGQELRSAFCAVACKYRQRRTTLFESNHSYMKSDQTLYTTSNRTAWRRPWELDYKQWDPLNGKTWTLLINLSKCQVYVFPSEPRLERFHCIHVLVIVTALLTSNKLRPFPFLSSSQCWSTLATMQSCLLDYPKSWRDRLLQTCKEHHWAKVGHSLIVENMLSLAVYQVFGLK